MATDSARGLFVLRAEFATWLSEELGQAEHMVRHGPGRLNAPDWSKPVECDADLRKALTFWVNWTRGDASSPARHDHGPRPDNVDFDTLYEDGRTAYRQLTQLTGSRPPAWLQSDRRIAHKPRDLTAPETSGTEAGHGPTLSVTQLYAAWLREHGLRGKTRAEYQHIIDAFVAVLGADADVRAITKDDVRTYKDLLLRKPVRLSKAEAALPLSDLLQRLGDHHGLPTLSVATVRKHLTALSSVFGWAARNGYIDANPTLGIQPSRRLANPDRQPYTVDDLNRIFHWPLFVGAKSVTRLTQRGAVRIRDARYWLPLLALYTGARLEELGQLRLTDVQTLITVDHLYINQADGDQSLKNVGSTRRVPQHAELKRLGFLAYVDQMRSAGHERLFPDLKPRRFGADMRWTP